MLLAGGNAVDAAVATAFALAVHEPAMSHLGGQGNMLVHLAETGETVALDFYACAPGASSPDMYEWIPGLTQGDYRFNTRDERNTVGALAVAIPGNVCGWVTAQERWGRLALDEVVAPAVRDAQRGSRATARTASFISEHQDRLARFEASTAVFLHPDGRPRAEGEVILQPDLAETILGIGSTGLEPFYRGPLGQQIAEFVQSQGGVLTEHDLERYPAELMWVREPDWVDFLGHRVAGATPASSALLFNLLGILDSEVLVQTRDRDAAQHHFIVEAMKLAFAERLEHIGDHTQVNVPLKGLMNPQYTRARRALIDPQAAAFPGPGDPWSHQDEAPDPEKLTGARQDPPAPMVGTTHHSHVDRWGNFVSLSQSLGDAFGSCITVPGTGIILNNAMKLFDPRPGERPAGIAPFKRPMAPWPTLVFKDGQARMALGSPSGTRIPNAIAQVLINLIVHDMGLQEAVNRPRLHWSGDELEAESDLPQEVRDGLADRHHEVEYRSARSPWFGAVQVVSRDPATGICRGAADPRRDGAAAGANFADPLLPPSSLGAQPRGTRSEDDHARGSTVKGNET
jgi:gamma-glutamyltranspeptidase/glutathione hydrolase